MMWRSRSSGLHDESFLAVLGQRLHAIAESVQPREEFRSSLRTFLMMEASTALVPDPSRPAVDVARRVRVAPRRRIVIATAFVATTLGLGGLSTASASALPGEALYPVKRASERVELSLHRDLADRGAFELELAERRLDEARQLSERGGEDSDDLAAKSVRDFKEAAASGTADLLAAFRENPQPGTIMVLNRFTARSDDVLKALEPQLPAVGAGAVADARDQLDSIDSRSDQLCPSCGGGLDESSTPPPGPDDQASEAPEPQTEPEPEPESPPSTAPEPPAYVPPDNSSSDSDTQDVSDSDTSDSDSQPSPSDSLAPEPIPTPTPEPIPTPEPTPTEPVPTPTEPIPTPTEPVPTPTEPIPTPTEPIPTPTVPIPTPEPPSVLDIIPGTVDVVTGALDALL